MFERIDANAKNEIYNGTGRGKQIPTHFYIPLPSIAIRMRLMDHQRCTLLSARKDPRQTEC
jgi:hypothetical protein